MKKLYFAMLLVGAFILSTNSNATNRTNMTSSQLAASVETESRIDVNKATVEQLVKIKGLGPAKAAAIIKYRKEIGGFEHIDELIGVRGIGNKALITLKKSLKVKD